MPAHLYSDTVAEFFRKPTLSYPHTYTQIHAEITVPNFLLLKISLISRSIIALSLLMLEKKKIPVALFKIRWPKTAQLYVCSSVHVCAYTCTHTCVLAVYFSLEGNCKQVALSTELAPFSLMIFKYFSSEFKPLHILHSCQSKRNTAVQMPGVLYHSMATSMEPTAEHHRCCKML